MKKAFTLTICFMLGLLAMACGGLSGESKGADMNEIFADMEKGIREKDESLFKKHWHAEGYTENLVGGSGLAGERVFEQGSRKKWFLKPDLGKTEKVGKVTIVPAEVYAWERDKKVDEVHLAIIEEDDGSLKILGGGEDLDEVKNLAERFNEGKSLSAAG